MAARRRTGPGGAGGTEDRLDAAADGGGRARRGGPWSGLGQSVDGPDAGLAGLELAETTAERLLLVGARPHGARLADVDSRQCRNRLRRSSEPSRRGPDRSQPTNVLDMRFSGCRADGLVLSEMAGERVCFEGCDLAGSDWARARIGELRIHDGELAGADFAGADLAGAHLHGSTLAGVNPRRAPARRGDPLRRGDVGSALARSDLLGRCRPPRRNPYDRLHPFMGRGRSSLNEIDSIHRSH
jgi:hypothetical protein